MDFSSWTTVRSENGRPVFVRPRCPETPHRSQIVRFCLERYVSALHLDGMSCSPSSPSGSCTRLKIDCSPIPRRHGERGAYAVQVYCVRRQTRVSSLTETVADTVVRRPCSRHRSLCHMTFVSSVTRIGRCGQDVEGVS